MKRSDVDQSFPVILQNDDVNDAKPMDYHKIVDHMDTQGYDLKFSEKKILSLAQKTKLERDLGEYIEYRNELIKFFKQIKAVQNIAGLYEKKIKKLRTQGAATVLSCLRKCKVACHLPSSALISASASAKACSGVFSRCKADVIAVCMITETSG